MSLRLSLDFTLRELLQRFQGAPWRSGAASMTAETAPEWTATRRLAWERQRDAVTEKSQSPDSKLQSLESLHNHESTIPARECAAAGPKLSKINMPSESCARICSRRGE